MNTTLAEKREKIQPQRFLDKIQQTRPNTENLI